MTSGYIDDLLFFLMNYEAKPNAPLRGSTNEKTTQSEVVNVKGQL